MICVGSGLQVHGALFQLRVQYANLVNDLANDLDLHIIPSGALLILLIRLFDVWSEVTYILLEDKCSNIQCCISEDDCLPPRASSTGLLEAGVS